MTRRRPWAFLDSVDAVELILAVAVIRSGTPPGAVALPTLIERPAVQPPGSAVAVSALPAPPMMTAQAASAVFVMQPA